MEEKKTREQLLEEQVRELQVENEKLRKEKEMYEAWWRQADAKALDLAENLKSIATLANSIYNSTKS